MRPTPVRLGLAAMAVGTLLLAGCGSDTTSTPSVTTADDATTLTVCSDMPYEPFEFDEAGTTTGFDHDLLSAMAERFDADVQFRATPFDTIVASLVAGDCQVIASAMTITDDRAAQVAFTQPYLDADLSLLVRAGDAGAFTTLDALAGTTIGVVSGTAGADHVTANAPPGSTIEEFQTGEEAVDALLAGRIGAVVQDDPSNAYQTTLDDRLVVTEVVPTGEQYGFATAPTDTALRDQLDAALSALRADGTYDEISTTWFGPPR